MNSHIKLKPPTMITFFKLLLLSTFILWNLHSTSVFGQGVAINNDASEADPSSMLDVKSTGKGILIPRMSASNRTGISNPATGLLVYQIDNPKGFYYNTGTSSTPNWIQLSSTLIDKIEDADGDTNSTS